MTFVHPWLGLLAAAIGVPLLLLLYLLKLRRETMRVPSTLLWRSSFEDVQVNVPFQRLRWSLLLLLQLALVLLISGAIAQPRIAGEVDAPSRLIVLIDQSASMGAAVDAETTRLDLAKLAAQELAERLSESAEAKSMMVVSFGASPRLVCGFESDRRALADAIESIEQTDEVADAEAALQLAGAFAQRGERGKGGADEASDAERPGVVLISDGGVGEAPDAGGFKLRAGSFRLIAVPSGAGAEAGAARNVGIVSCSARRSKEDASRVLLFVRLANAGPQPIEALVTVRVDHNVETVRRMAIPAAIAGGPAGESAETIELMLSGGGMLTVSHNIRDELPADDAAAVVMPAPQRARIVIVHGGEQPDPFLHDVLAVTQAEELRVMSRETWERAAVDETGADMIVFDSISGHTLPGTPSITVGGVPAGVETVEPRTGGGKRMMSWLRQHSIMRSVSLDTLAYAGFGGIKLPSGGEALATGPDGPVIALLRSRSARHVVVGFRLAQSNWPTHVSLAVFMQNALDALLMGASGQTGRAIRPGEPFDVRIAGGVRELIVRGPVERRIAAREGDERVTLAGLPRAGLYAVEGAAAGDAALAVSVLDDVESDTRVRLELPVRAQGVDPAAGDRGGRRDIWPWLVMAALGIAILEWIAYLRRMRI